MKINISRETKNMIFWGALELALVVGLKMVRQAKGSNGPHDMEPPHPAHHHRDRRERRHHR